MKFFVLFKKENFRNDLINDSFLSSVNAPSLIANEFVKDDRENALVYLYLYNHIYTESEGYSGTVTNLGDFSTNQFSIPKS
jgi:hypothetical protein